MSIENEIIALRKEVNSLKGNCGLTSNKEISIWISANTRKLGLPEKGHGFSEPSLDLYLKRPLSKIKEEGRSLEAIKKGLIKAKRVFIKTAEIISEYPLKRGKDNYIYKKRKKDVTVKFVYQRIENYLLKGEVVRIDAIGTQLSAVRRAIEDLESEKRLPKILARFLILAPNSPGSKTRNTLENKQDREIDDSVIKPSLINMKRLKKELESSGLGSSLILRKYFFTPGFMIIRINQNMMVSPYLNKKKAYYEPYMEITKTSQPRLFKDFADYFEAVFIDESLSERI